MSVAAPDLGIDVVGEPTRPERPAALLWDLDGTLVDTEPFWQKAEREIVAAAGGTWTDDLANAVVGFDLLAAARFMRAQSPVTLPPEAIVDHLLDRVVAAVSRGVPWRPGARELVRAAVAAGIPTALVTMSWRRLTDVVIEALPPGTFTAVVTGDEVCRGKPDPEPYLSAARRLGVDPAACIAIEDSPTGVQSAIRAGVPTVGVPHLVDLPPMPGLVVVPTLAGLDLEALVALVGAGGGSVGAVQPTGRR